MIKLEQVLCTAYLGVVFTFYTWFIKLHQSVKIIARLTRIEIVIFFFFEANSIVITVVVVVVFVVVVVGAVLFLCYELISREFISIFLYFSANQLSTHFSVTFKFLYSTK